MQLKYSHKIKHIVTLLLFLAYSGLSQAYYYAYVPDLSGDENGKYLHVVNTDLEVLVDSIPLFGDPREVVLNHKGNYVFVSSVVTEGSFSVSKINIISTQLNENKGTFNINNADYIRSLTISQDDTSLYVTHSNGITRIKGPTTTFEQTSLTNLTYTGMSLALSDDDKYLFVVGTDGNNNDGISVVDVSQDTMQEIASYSLGTGAGVTAVIFDKLYNELYVLNRVSAQLINLKINNYDTPSNLTLTENGVKQFLADSYPSDLAISEDSSEIYVALSYLYDGAGYGDGEIVLIDPSDLSKAAIYNIDLSKEEGVFSPEDGSGAVHPLAIGFDESGTLHVVKQLWNERAGTYVSLLRDVTDIRTKTRRIYEINSVNLGKKSSTQINGKFVGTNCSYCPTGIESETQPVIRPSAINIYMLLFILLSLFVIRFKFNEINHSRS